MVRKRAREPIRKVERKKIDFEVKKKVSMNNKIIILILVSLFALTLYLNAYNNYASGVGVNKNGGKSVV